jgi:hypothetical protein
MAASELGLAAFASRHDLLDSLTVFRLCSIEERLRHLPRAEAAQVSACARLPLSYRSARTDLDALLQSDVILFWGDFLHMAQYVRALDAALIGLDDVPTRADAAALIRRVLLLGGSPAARKRRSLSFGTTLLFNTLADETEGAYGRDFRDLMSGLGHIWVRDVFSAAKVAHVRGDYTTSFWGCDCAQLLHRADLDRFAPAGQTGGAHAGGLAFFAGRSPDAAAALFQLASDLAAALDIPCAWLPWGSTSAFPLLDRIGSGIPNDGEPLDVAALLRHVADSRLVVTDTYHLALVAWTFGVPAVLLAASPALGADVNAGPALGRRDKREVLFSQYDLLDFLVRDHELASPASAAARAARILERLGDAGFLDALTARLRSHAAASESACAAAVRAMLDAGRPVPAALT